LDEGKSCRKCGEWKPLIKFASDPSCNGGRRATCKSCNGSDWVGVKSRRLNARGEVEVVEFEVEELPIEVPDIKELLDIRKRAFSRKKAFEDKRDLIQVKIKIDGPIGLWFCGDPHLDDDGTDINAIERDLKTVRESEGFLATSLGDHTNNWVGRLAKLYSEQTTSAAEGWALTEWFVRQADWLFLLGGNHDCWSGSGDPIKWMVNLSECQGIYEPVSCRLNLAFPNKKNVVINSRHDFRGNSQWNPAHAVMKAAQLGFHDHVLVCGHKHQSGYGVVKDPKYKILSHCIQVASYKIHDNYAKTGGFLDHHISPSASLIIDPDAKDERSLIHLFWDPEEAADMLEFKRKKWKMKK